MPTDILWLIQIAKIVTYLFNSKLMQKTSISTANPSHFWGTMTFFEIFEGLWSYLVIIPSRWGLVFTLQYHRMSRVRILSKKLLSHVSLIFEEKLIRISVFEGKCDSNSNSKWELYDFYLVVDVHTRPMPKKKSSNTPPCSNYVFASFYLNLAPIS